MVFIFIIHLWVYTLSPHSLIAQKGWILKRGFFSTVVITSDHEVYKVPSKENQGEGARVDNRRIDIMFKDEWLFYSSLKNRKRAYPLEIPVFKGSFDYSQFVKKFGKIEGINLKEVQKGVKGLIFDECQGVEYYSFLEDHFKDLSMEVFVEHWIEGGMFFNQLLNQQILPGDFKSKNIFMKSETQQFSQMVDHATSLIAQTDCYENRPVYLPTLILIFESFYNLLIRIPTNQGREGEVYKSYQEWFNYINLTHKKMRTFSKNPSNLWESIYLNLSQYTQSQKQKKVLCALNMIFLNISFFQLQENIKFSLYLKNCLYLNNILMIFIGGLQEDLKNESRIFESIQFKEVNESHLNQKQSLINAYIRALAPRIVKQFQHDHHLLENA